MRRLFTILAFLLLTLSCHAQTMTLTQSATSRKLVFLMVSSSDHITGATGLTVTVTLSKNAAAFGAPAGTVAEVANGWYALTPTSADTGTLGSLILHASATGADPADKEFNVILPNLDTSSTGGLPITDSSNAVKVQSGTGANQISLASGLVTVGTNNDKTGYTASTVSDKTGYSLTASQSFNNAGQTTKYAATLAAADVTGNLPANLVTYLPGGGSATALGASFLFPNATVGTSVLTQSLVTGGAYPLQTDGSGYLKLSNGTGTGQLSLSSGLVSLSGTQTFNLTGNVTGNLSGSVGSVTGAVGSVTGNVGGSVASVTGAVGSVTGAVGSVTGNVGGSVASVVGAVGSVTGNVIVGGYAAGQDPATLILAGVIDGSITLKQAQALQLSLLSGNFLVADDTTAKTRTVTYYRRDGTSVLAVMVSHYSDTGLVHPTTRAVPTFSNLP